MARVGWIGRDDGACDRGETLGGGRGNSGNSGCCWVQSFGWLMWVLLKIGVGPQNGWWKSWKDPIKHGMIWGFSHYFWKHPCGENFPNQVEQSWRPLDGLFERKGWTCADSRYQGCFKILHPKLLFFGVVVIPFSTNLKIPYKDCWNSYIDSLMVGPKEKHFEASTEDPKIARTISCSPCGWFVDRRRLRVSLGPALFTCSPKIIVIW